MAMVRRERRVGGQDEGGDDEEEQKGEEPKGGAEGIERLHGGGANRIMNDKR